MTAQASDDVPGAQAAPSADPYMHGAGDDPGTRGRITVRGRAAARIVEIAALEVPGVVRRTTRLGSLTGRDLPRAIVDLGPAQPNVRLDVALTWPGQVAALCVQVRQQVADELFHHLGRRPSRVDIAVAELVPVASDTAEGAENQ